MVGPTHRQSSLFYVALGTQAALLKDPVLDLIDTQLDDPALLKLVADALARRCPRSKLTGRKSIAPDRLLRCCALKHLRRWSFRELERELRGSLVYRRFTRFDHEKTPDFSTFSKNFALLGTEATEAIHDRVVQLAFNHRIALGYRLRTDTTVVETNVHYPTDSGLLADGMRVLTRSLAHIAKECQQGAVKVVDHARSVKWRVLEINRAAKSMTDAARGRLRASYGRLMALAARTVTSAEKVCRDLGSGKTPIVGEVGRIIAAEYEIRRVVPLLKKVLAQTKARVFHGDQHLEGKVLSLFEEHTLPIRKGKMHRPTEFGRLVRLDEVENGIVSGYEIPDGAPADADSWQPALARHQRVFRRPPRMAAGDRGFFSAKNERLARLVGVKRVAIPGRGRLSTSRARLQKEPWFRRALRWRAGIERRISALKHPFGMLRAMYKGERGFKRYVGWCVITNNLVSLARALARRDQETKPHAATRRAA